MEVGDLVNEAAVKAYCRTSESYAITCREVCVLKNKLNVKMRMVAHKIAKGQESMCSKGQESVCSLMMSSSTSSVESLKLVLN